MFKFKRMALLTGTATLLAPIAPAMAAGTTAGTSIQNTATVSYQVNGVNQTPATSNTDSFTVDRKINLLVTQKQTDTTSVSPGQQAAVTTFSVQNTSNAALDFILTAAQLASNTAAPNGGTDSFDGTNTRVFVDSNGNGVYDAGVDTRTFVDELAADATATVFVVTDIPAGATNGSKAAVSLTAQAAEAGTAGTQGAAVTQTAGANTKAGAADTVFADGAGTDDAAADGKSSARSDYKVAAANLSVNKTSTVARDGLTPGTAYPNAKAIPGAFVQYCIAVTNAAGGAAASNLTVNDVVVGTMTVQPGTILVGATQNTTTGQCTGGAAPAAANNASSGNTVNVTIPTLAAGSSTAVSFEAQIK